MNREGVSGRELKYKVFDLLKSTDIESAMEGLRELSGKQVINPLFSFLYNRDQRVKWAAVTAMGAVVAELAEQDMEAARVIMRRLMWNLNDESGGIGWGSPEAMGEILACHEGLAKEYAHVLISYTREDGNYLEHDMLQRGLIWGIGRLSQIRPQLVQSAIPYLLPYLESNDASVRGLAAWVMGMLVVEEVLPRLDILKNDESQVQIYLEHRLIDCRVMDLAGQALNRIKSNSLAP